jgi:hypothetical protein
MDEEGRDIPERQRREERMRYEVLLMLYRACNGAPDEVVRAWSFSTDLGVWQAEVFRVIEWLERHRLIQYHGAGPSISITREGVAYLESGSNRRCTVRDPGVLD